MKTLIEIVEAATTPKFVKCIATGVPAKWGTDTYSRFTIYNAAMVELQTFSCSPADMAALAKKSGVAFIAASKEETAR